MFTKLKSMLRPSAGIVAALLVLAVQPNAFAASEMKATVPFAFDVGSKTLPPGTYVFDFDRNLESVMVRGGSSNQGVQALIITRIAGTPRTSGAGSHIVFDKVGDKYILSELWEPVLDGFLVHAEKRKHEHHVLRAKH